MNIKFDAQGVERTIDILRKTEPETLRELRKEIKTDPALLAASSSIKSEIPAIAPLSGFNSHNGDTKYVVPQVKPEFRTSKMRLGRAEQPLVTISTISPKNGVGFEIIDMAGRGPGARTPRGANMIRKLSSSPSRYVYRGFEKKQDGLVDGVRKIIEKYAEKVNVKLKVM